MIRSLLYITEMKHFPELSIIFYYADGLVVNTFFKELYSGTHPSNPLNYFPNLIWIISKSSEMITILIYSPSNVATRETVECKFEVEFLENIHQGTGFSLGQQPAFPSLHCFSCFVL